MTSRGPCPLDSQTFLVSELEGNKVPLIQHVLFIDGKTETQKEKKNSLPVVSGLILWQNQHIHLILEAPGPWWPPGLSTGLGYHLSELSSSEETEAQNSPGSVQPPLKLSLLPTPSPPRWAGLQFFWGRASLSWAARCINQFDEDVKAFSLQLIMAWFIGLALVW